jgi:hypothetical protein
MYKVQQRAGIAQQVWRLGHGLGDQKIEVRFPTRAKDSSLHYISQTNLLSKRHLVAISPPVKRQEGNGGHSPSSSAEVKNIWRYTSTPLSFLIVWSLIK